MDFCYKFRATVSLRITKIRFHFSNVNSLTKIEIQLVLRLTARDIFRSRHLTKRLWTKMSAHAIKNSFDQMTRSYQWRSSWKVPRHSFCSDCIYLIKEEKVRVKLCCFLLFYTYTLVFQIFARTSRVRRGEEFCSIKLRNSKSMDIDR